MASARLYERALALGELVTYPGRITPASAFVGSIVDALAGLGRSIGRRGSF